MVTRRDIIAVPSLRPVVPYDQSLSGTVGLNGTFSEGAKRLEASTTDEARYRLLVEAVTDYAIYMLDPTGVVTSWNPGARRFKGYEASEILGGHFSRFYTEEDRRAGLPQRALETSAREGRFESAGWR